LRLGEYSRGLNTANGESMGAWYQVTLIIKNVLEWKMRISQFLGEQGGTIEE
jgi:hypothetical protein